MHTQHWTTCIFLWLWRVKLDRVMWKEQTTVSMWHADSPGPSNAVCHAGPFNSQDPLDNFIMWRIHCFLLAWSPSTGYIQGTNMWNSGWYPYTGWYPLVDIRTPDGIRYPYTGWYPLVDIRTPDGIHWLISVHWMVSTGWYLYTGWFCI